MIYNPAVRRSKLLLSIIIPIPCTVKSLLQHVLFYPFHFPAAVAGRRITVGPAPDCRLLPKLFEWIEGRVLEKPQCRPIHPGLDEGEWHSRRLC